MNFFSTRTKMPLFLIKLLLLLAVLTSSSLGHAGWKGDGWNPVKTLKKGLSKIGEIAGAPFGGFIDSVTQPTINSAENAGHRLIGDMDDRMKSRIAQIADTMDKTTGQIDKSMEVRLSQLDNSMEQRIYQLDGVISKSLLEVDRIGEARIGQLDQVAKARIDQVDVLLERRIEQVDRVLENRIEQVDIVLGDAIAEVDQRIETRINQMDEIAENRIGNADVVATKATLSFESAITRIVGIACFMTFVSFLLWRIIVIGRDHWEAILAESGARKRLSKTWEVIGPRLLLQGGAGVVALLIIYSLFLYFPGSERGRINTVAASHEQAFNESLASFDFRRARFHASQLQILVPAGNEGVRYRGLALKVDLIRDVLTRPGLLQSPQGLTEVMQLSSRVSSYLPSDPDVLTIQGYITWNTGGSRDSEYEAARLCMKAIDAASNTNSFAMLPLATNYLQAYLVSPLPEELAKQAHDKLHPASDDDNVGFASIDSITTTLEIAQNKLDVILSDDSGARVAAVRHILDYNKAGSELLTVSGSAYFEMLKAHATYEAEVLKGVDKNDVDRQEKIDSRIAESNIDVFDKDSGELLDPPTDKKKWNSRQWARYERLKQALQVVEAWREFDAHLRDNFWIADSPTALSAFKLNDAIYTRAVWFLTNPNSDELAPTLSGVLVELDNDWKWEDKNVFDALGGEVEKDEKGLEKKDDKGNLVVKFPAEAQARLESLLAISPPRLVWADRYQPLIGDAGRVIMNFQEFERFQSFEKHLARFDHAYVKYATERSMAESLPKVHRNGHLAAFEAAGLGLFITENGKSRPISLMVQQEMQNAVGDDYASKPEIQPAFIAEVSKIVSRLRATRSPLL